MSDAYAEPDPIPDLDTLESLLVAALDGMDSRRIELMTLLALVQLEPDREAALARLRREGFPPVFRL